MGQNGDHIIPIPSVPIWTICEWKATRLESGCELIAHAGSSPVLSAVAVRHFEDGHRMRATGSLVVGDRLAS